MIRVLRKLEVLKMIEALKSAGLKILETSFGWEMLKQDGSKYRAQHCPFAALRKSPTHDMYIVRFKDDLFI